MTGNEENKNIFCLKRDANLSAVFLATLKPAVQALSRRFRHFLSKVYLCRRPHPPERKLKHEMMFNLIMTLWQDAAFQRLRYGAVMSSCSPFPCWGVCASSQLWTCNECVGGKDVIQSQISSLLFKHGVVLTNRSIHRAAACCSRRSEVKSAVSTPSRKQPQ